MIPEETLISAVCEVLGTGEIDESLFKKKIGHIEACPGNLLRFLFRDGGVVEYVWADRSRSESWTPEMKETARAAQLRRNQDGR